jgi:ABC-type bacteriocin/lantibiotic exporter with double-glycine peptidase domain
MAAGKKVKLINEPEDFVYDNQKLLCDVELASKLTFPVDYLLLFAKSKNELKVELPAFSNFVNNDGYMIISVPGNNAYYITDITREEVIKIAESTGMKYLHQVQLDKMWESYVLIHKNGRTR